MKVTLTVKRLLDCPLDKGRAYVKLKWGWGPRAIFSGKAERTFARQSENRTISWEDATQDEDSHGDAAEDGAKANPFEYECSVFLDPQDVSHDEDTLSKLRKKQTSLAHLRLSLRIQKEEASKQKLSKRKLGYVDIPLVDWAVLYGNQREHNIRHLLQDTRYTSLLELSLQVSWIDGGPQTQGVELPTSVADMSVDAATSEHNLSSTSAKMLQGSDADANLMESDTIGGQADLWSAYKMAELADTTRKDSVHEALTSSRLSPEENLEMIDALVKAVLGKLSRVVVVECVLEGVCGGFLRGFLDPVTTEIREGGQRAVRGGREIEKARARVSRSQTRAPAQSMLTNACPPARSTHALFTTQCRLRNDGLAHGWRRPRSSGEGRNC